MNQVSKNKLIVPAMVLVGLSLFSVSTAAPLPELDCLVEPNMVVDVGSPEHGVVATVSVDRSDTVAVNDVLAKLESSEQTASVRKARAQVNMEAEIKAREASLAFARRKQERMRDLYASDAISSHQRDEVETELKMAQMQLQQARDSAKLARIELDRARSDLGRRTIRSPISGVVVERFVAPGEYVNEKPLMRVAQMDPLRVETIAPASLFGKIRPGMKARVTAEAYGTEALQAEVKIVDRLIDPASGTFGIRLELPNPDYAIPSGLNCRLSIDPTIRKAESTPPPAAAKPVATRSEPPTAPVSAKDEQSAPAKQASRTGTIERKLAAATPAVPVQTAVATATKPAASSNEAPVCTTLGPVRGERQLAALINALGDDARELRRRSGEGAIDRFIVLTMPLPTVGQARSYGQSLRKQGVVDLAVMTRDPYRGRISLGLYSTVEAAEAHVQRMAAFDIETVIQPYFVNSSQFWLDVEMPAEMLADAPWKDAVPGVGTAACEPSSYVMAETSAAEKKDR